MLNLGWSTAVTEDIFFGPPAACLPRFILLSFTLIAISFESVRPISLNFDWVSVHFPHNVKPH